MLTTVTQKAVNAGLTNEEVTTYGWAILGLVVVQQSHLCKMLKVRDYPLHSVFGKKFFFCFFERCY